MTLLRVCHLCFNSLYGDLQTTSEVTSNIKIELIDLKNQCYNAFLAGKCLYFKNVLAADCDPLTCVLVSRRR